MVDEESYLPSDQLMAPFEARVARLLENSEPLDSIHAGRLMRLRLDRAVTRLKMPQPPRCPFTIVMLGGTGVGKSALFSTLVGQPNASPSSDVRCFTKQPFIAVHSGDRPLVAIPPGLEPIWVDIPEAGVALIDTPDIDGLLERNHEVTRQIVEMGDLIVYVSFPDKQADEAALRELRHWSGQKRRFFVLNKMDRYPDHAAIRTSFDQRLAALGFHVEDSVRFLVSSVQPDQFDFPRLRQAVLQPRHDEQVELLRHDTFLALLTEAALEDITTPLETLARDLRKKESDFLDRLRAAYTEGLRSPEAKTTIQTIVSEATWRQACSRCGPLMLPAVWIRTRFNLLLGGYSANRLMRMGGMAGLVGAGASMVLATARGLLPMRQLVESLGPKFARTLTEVSADVRRYLEDRRLERLVPGLYPKTTPEKQSGGSVDPVQAAFEWVDRTMNRYVLANLDEEVVRNLNNDVERLGDRSAEQALSKSWGAAMIWVANLIPFGLLGWVVYRLAMGWWDERYYFYGLPFYMMSLAMVLAGMVPGYWWISRAIRRQMRRLDPTTLVREIDQSKASAPLRQAAESLESLARDARELARSASEMREELSGPDGLTRASFGATVKRNG